MCRSFVDWNEYKDRVSYQVLVWSCAWCDYWASLLCTPIFLLQPSDLFCTESLHPWECRPGIFNEILQCRNVSDQTYFERNWFSSHWNLFFCKLNDFSLLLGLVSLLLDSLHSVVQPSTSYVSIVIILPWLIVCVTLTWILSWAHHKSSWASSWSSAPHPPQQW